MKSSRDSTPIKSIWRKAATSFAVEVDGSIRELRIVRTRFGAFTIFLDESPLEPELKIPASYFSAKEVRLPDGSSLWISPWGASGWSVKHNGIPLKRTSGVKPILVLALVVLIGTFGSAQLSLYIFGRLNEPQWKKSPPPPWAYLTSSADGRSRFFIYTKEIRKRPEVAGVTVLFRDQTVASGESANADVPKDDDFTAVRNFICDPGRDGYALSATLRGFSGRQIPVTIPPDSDLPKMLATRDFAQIQPGTVIAEAHRAACYLAGYR